LPQTALVSAPCAESGENGIAYLPSRCGLSHLAEQLRAKRLLPNGISVHKARDICHAREHTRQAALVGLSHLTTA